VIFCFFIFLLRIGIFISGGMYSIGVGVYSIVGVTCIRIEMMIMLVLLLVVRAGASLGFFGVLSPLRKGRKFSIKE